MSRDWNDLHIEQGLDVVRGQLEAVAQLVVPNQCVDLPHTPSLAEPADAGGAPAPEGGGGSGWTAERIFQRFALVEGKAVIVACGVAKLEDAAEQTSAIIGGVLADGTRTGLQALLDGKSRFNAHPSAHGCFHRPDRS